MAKYLVNYFGWQLEEGCRLLDRNHGVRWEWRHFFTFHRSAVFWTPPEETHDSMASKPVRMKDMMMSPPYGKIAIMKKET